VHTSRLTLILVSLLFIGAPIFNGCAQGRFHNDLRAEHEEFPHPAAEQRRFPEALKDPHDDYHNGNRYWSIGPYYGDLYYWGG
jgi:hypothetical protein